MSNNHTLGKFTKRLAIDFEVNNGGALNFVDSLFPNLEEVTFSGYDEFCYPNFWKMVIDGKFSNLKDLPIPESGEDCEAHVQCLYFMKDWVTGIDILDSSEKFKVIYNRLLSNIEQFPRLERINMLVTKYDNQRTQCITECIEAMTEKNLTTVQNLRFHTQNFSSESFSNIDVSNIQPAIHIKSLDLCMEPLVDEVFSVPSNEFMTYLMIKFPNLNSINLENGDEFGEELVFPSNFDDTTQSNSITIQFLVYLFEIPFSSLKRIINSSENTSEIILGLFNTLEKKKKLEN